MSRGRHDWHEVPSKEPAGATAGWDREKGIWTSAAAHRRLLGARGGAPTAHAPSPERRRETEAGPAALGGSGEAPSHFPSSWSLGFCFHRFGPVKIYFLLAILLFLVANMS